MRRGLDWYKRDPIAFLGGIQGLSAREIAVYTVVLELIYQHGGEIHDDPKWIAGWIADMGSAAVRKVVQQLVAKGKIKVTETGSLTNGRAQNEVKTAEKLRENREKTGKKGGICSGKSRRAASENKDLAEASASTHVEQIREDKSNGRSSSLRSEHSTGADAPRSEPEPAHSEVDPATIIFTRGLALMERLGVKEARARPILGKWRQKHGDARVIETLGRMHREQPVDPIAFAEGCFRHAKRGPPKDVVAGGSLL